MPVVPKSPSKNGERMKHLVIVGCGKTKRPVVSEARDLYTGQLFQYARRYAERFGDCWRIVSARYGLLHPRAQIEPYDDSLTGKRQQLLRAWGAGVQADLIAAFHAMDIKAKHGQWLDPPAVVLLAGKDYIEPMLRWTFLASGRVHIETPLDGMGIGQRIAWLKRQVSRQQN